MEAAYRYGAQLVLNKTTLDKAAALVKREKRVTISRSTLCRRVRDENRGTYGSVKRVGRLPVLCIEQENGIVDLCREFCKHGAPILEDDIADFVQILCGKQPQAQAKLRNGRTGNDWLNSLWKRHKLTLNKTSLWSPPLVIKSRSSVLCVFV